MIQRFIEAIVGIVLRMSRTLFLTLIGLGLFDMFRFGRGHTLLSIFVVSEPITTKFCTAIDYQSVSLNMKKIA